MNSTVRVAVTGAAGQIGYSLLFRIASGEMLGPQTPVELRLLEIPTGVEAAEGAAMELDDCAFPLLRGIEVSDDARVAFEGVNIALLVGARPRTKDMERSDLLKFNGAIFRPQGAALNERAARDIKVLVVGNPANTNCLIAGNNAPDIPGERFTSMMRLDHNRAIAQLARKASVAVSEVSNVSVWGNHSMTQYPDIQHARLRGHPAAEVIGDEAWVTEEFIPIVQRRGVEIIEARGSSSAASAANAAIEHVHDWILGTPDGDWVSMGVLSDGSYGIPEGLIAGFPCRCEKGEWAIVQGLDLDDFSHERIQASVNELEQERAGVRELDLI